MPRNFNSRPLTTYWLHMLKSQTAGMSSKEAAQYLGVSTGSFYRMRKGEALSKYIIDRVKDALSQAAPKPKPKACQAKVTVTRTMAAPETKPIHNPFTPMVENHKTLERIERKLNLLLTICNVDPSSV